MTQNTRPLVSIGIPTYNRANGYLKQCLQSAVDQTYPNIEIIVGDNCSSDDTDKVVAGFADPRIRYFKHPENIGPNNNFNFCLNQAGGAYFLLLHDDDLLDPDFIECCMNEAKDRTDVGIIRTGTRIIDAHGTTQTEAVNRVKGLPTKEFFLGWFDRQTALYLCSTLFNTEQLKEIGGFKSKTDLFQDVVAELILAARHGRIDVPDIKASFRNHPDEITYSSKVSDWCEDSLYLLDIMCDLDSANREIIRKRGMVFFCRTNYNRTIKVKNFTKRMATFFLVYKRFDYRYSPFKYYFYRNKKRALSVFKKLTLQNQHQLNG